MGARDETEAQAVLKASARRKMGITMGKAYATLKSARLAQWQSRSTRTAAIERRRVQENDLLRRQADYYNHFNLQSGSSGDWGWKR